MSSEIVGAKGGYNFAKGLADARRQLGYYQEGLLMDVAARVVAAMESRGVTRAELARRLEVSPAYVTKMLRGHANLSIESLAKLAFALDLRWECILIPKDARIGVLSIIDESGATVLRHAETLVGIENQPASKDRQDEQAARYEWPVPSDLKNCSGAVCELPPDYGKTERK